MPSRAEYVPTNETDEQIKQVLARHEKVLERIANIPSHAKIRQLYKQRIEQGLPVDRLFLHEYEGK